VASLCADRASSASSSDLELTDLDITTGCSLVPAKSALECCQARAAIVAASRLPRMSMFLLIAHCDRELKVGDDTRSPSVC
jgi:hypothetical protein